MLVGAFALLVVENTLFAPLVDFYPLRLSGLGGVTLGLTALAAGVLGTTLAFPPGSRNIAPRLAERVHPGGMLRFAVILFTLYALSTAAYWYVVDTEIGLAQVLRNPARLKSAELLGTIDADAPLFFFRNTLLVPVALVAAVYLNSGRRLPKLLLLAYAGTALLSVRRGPVLSWLSCALAVAVVSTPRLRGLLLLLGIGASGLAAISIALIRVLATLGISLEAALFGYTAGNLSSFQALLDGYYPPRAQLPMENTLYFFYSAFKFVDPYSAPASVIKPNPFQPLLPNTYTFFADYYLDAGVVGLVVFPALVGAVMGLAYSLVTRQPSYPALVLFGTVYAASTASFLNNEWTWLMIPASVVYALVAALVILKPCTAVARFSRRPHPSRPPTR